MAGEVQPRFGITSKYKLKENNWGEALSRDLCKIDQLFHLAVSGTGALPSSAANGTQWIDPAGNLQTYVNGWQECPSKKGMLALNCATGTFMFYDGSSWQGLLDGQAIQDAINNDPCGVYALNSGAGAPSGNPTNPFPFYVDTSTTPNAVWVFDCNNGLWYMLGGQHFEISPGTAGASPASNAAGVLDNSWFDCIDVGGTATQAAKLVKTNSDGYVDHSLLVATYADDATALAAGINQPGCSYFNSTDECEYIYVSDICDGTPGFVAKSTSDELLHLRDTAGFSVPHNSQVPFIFNDVVEDDCGLYDPVTGTITIKKDGVYAITYQVQLFQTGGGFSHLLEVNLQSPGFWGYDGNQYNVNVPHTSSKSSSNAIIYVRMVAGQTVIPRVFQLNTPGSARPSILNDGSYFMLRRVSK